jgi:outer membrane protein insertion porin family
MRLRLIPLLAVLAAFPVFSQEWYQGKTIQDIRFTGLRNAKIAELREIYEPYIGRPFSDGLFWELQNQLYALDYFETINASALRADAAGSRVIIQFEVREIPAVAGIYFRGNTYFPSETTFLSWFTGNALEDIVSLAEGDLAASAKLRADENAVRNRYLEEGFTEVRVRAETRDKGDSTVDVVFAIDEGRQTTVSEVHFGGNTAFSEDTLRGQLSMQDGPFQEAKLTADGPAIVQYYQNRGYVDAAVMAISRETAEDGEGGISLRITYTLSEGERYTFGGISFDGNAVFSTEDLSALLRSETGKFADMGRVRADVQRVMDAYYDAGYIYNSFYAEDIRDSANRVYSVVVRITERPQQARLGNIIVQGNEKTKTEIILREIPLRPGDVFSKQKIIEGIQNLYKLQYFSSVMPETPAGDAEGLVDLVINVEEQSSEEVQFGITFPAYAPDPNEEAPFRGTLKWSDSNLGGAGTRLVFGAEASVVSLGYQSFTAQYDQGWLFGKRFPLTLDLSVVHQKTWTAVYNAGFTEADIADKDNQKEYETFPASVGLSTGQVWQTALGGLGLRGGLRSGVEYDDITFTTYDPVLRDSDWTTTNSVWAALSLDARDNPNDPSFGYYAVQRASYTGIVPADRERYLKTDGKLEGFITFLKIPVSDSYTWKAVFGAHSGLTFIFPQPNRELSIEITHKPAVDGTFAGRGWTKYAYYHKGRVLFDNWAEIRLPVVPDILALDFFLDAAAASATPKAFFDDFVTDDFLYSCGAGLRIVYPGFPLRLLVAKRFLMRDGDILWQDGPFLKSNKANSGVNFVVSFALAY